MQTATEVLGGCESDNVLRTVVGCVVGDSEE